MLEIDFDLLSVELPTQKCVCVCAQSPITSETIRKLNLIRLNGSASMPEWSVECCESVLFSVDYHFDCVWMLLSVCVVWRCSCSANEERCRLEVVTFLVLIWSSGPK